VRVIGVNAGYAFSFLKNAAEEIRYAAVPREGSQFRSRDLFPQAAAAIALGRPDALAEAVPPGDLPDPPASAIGYVDGYGNIKTTIPHANANVSGEGARVRVRIGEAEHDAVAGDGTFAVPPGR
jgi:S-adenosylmethionine hydrolase